MISYTYKIVDLLSCTYEFDEVLHRYVHFMIVWYENKYDVVSLYFHIQNKNHKQTFTTSTSIIAVKYLK